MKEQIQHFGTVTKTEGSHIQVTIMQASACSTCSAAHLCQSSETKEKVIDVYGNYPEITLGQTVCVVGTIHQGLYATLWCYIVPLAVLLLTMIGALYLTDDDGIAALLSLAVLVPYYGIIYLLRDRFAKKFTFKIKQ